MQKAQNYRDMPGLIEFQPQEVSTELYYYYYYYYYIHMYTHLFVSQRCLYLRLHSICYKTSKGELERSGRGKSWPSQAFAWTRM